MHENPIPVMSLALALAAAGTPVAHAQTVYPAKPIRMIVGYTPGGPTDVTARVVAQRLSEQLDQPVIVENRAGAAGTLAAERVAASPADGYTLLIVTGADTIQPALRSNLPYDIERSFTPVTLLATGPLLLVVHPSVPAKSLKELLAIARAHPSRLSYGSAGIGTSSHLAAELLNQMAKLDTVHIPFKSSADNARAIGSGHIDMGFPGLTGALPFLSAGKLRGLAVTTTKRAALLPEVPTMDEAGVPGYDRSGWYGMLAPAGVPRDIVARLNGVVSKVLGVPEVQQALVRQGLTPAANSPGEFAAFIRHEVAQNAKLIKFSGAKGN
ncbi:MAG: tripartite tricarboxylate transporter substrate binding protein [Burkholderiales bacterium]|nr:tripartite tricarboxylate transporter substrate binding protein [Burkholderiales bacterium]